VAGAGQVGEEGDQANLRSGLARAPTETGRASGETVGR
jgi:hypothetical protein